MRAGIRSGPEFQFDPIVVKAREFASPHPKTRLATLPLWAYNFSALVDIILNGKPIEFEIETEATIGEVIDSLTRWLHEQGCVIVSARLDGKPFHPADDEATRALPISDDQRVECEAQNTRVLVMETVNELGQYLDRMARLAPGLADREVTDENIQQILEGLTWTEDVLNRVEEILRISYRDIEFEGEKFHKRVLRVGDIRDHIGEAHRSGNRAALTAILRDSVAPLCDTIVRALPVILEKGAVGVPADDLMDEISELQPVIQALPERLEAIAIKISIGDSAKGMEEFASAVSALERAFMLVDRSRKELSISLEELTIEGKSFDERNQALMAILQELIEAFERKDRVLIGDLIEYEIAPVTEALGGIMEKIQNSLKGSRH
jgi:hypothetical protein